MRLVAAAAFVLLEIPSLASTGDLLAPDRPIAEVVDLYVGAALAKEKVKAAPPADDATLLRRLTLDLAGRIPSAAESIAYGASADPQKRVRLVDRLMASPGFVRHQAAELDTMLMAGGRGSLRDYLVRAVGENRPWDRIFRELLLPDQTDPVGKAAAEYLRQGVRDLDRLTAQVSSTFFGVNISCAQCHDHPLVRDWKQDHFYGMKSFLNRTFVSGSGKDSFLGERGYGTIRFKPTDDVERPARMMFLTGRRVDGPDAKELSPDEQKKEKAALDRAKNAKLPPPPPRFSARAKLVELALQPVERDFFARAIVNRIWQRLIGQGLVMPLDQMHSANPPSHPELLAWLARDTVSHGYDLRRLIRGLVLSETYARSSRWDGPEEAPRPSLFAVAQVRPLAPLQLARSLRLATVDPATFPPDFQSRAFQERIDALEEGLATLAASFATSSGDAQIGVAEALFFSNGQRISSELLTDGAGRLIARLEQTTEEDQRIELAVRNVLSRPPDSDERHALAAFLDERTDRPDDAYRQLIWALLSGAEFRFNH
jgi:hypothetical protein